MSVSGRSIAVFGGNGFLGKRICEGGIRNGYTVYGLLRSGSKPKVETPHDAYWIIKVNWQQADVFNPKTYKKTLAEVDTVVHSIGMLFENQDYKKVMNSNFSVLNDVRNLANAIKGGNPMKKSYELTYEAVQRDSAVILADALIKSKSKKKKLDSVETPNFVYILADSQIPLIPSRYLTTKREAEFELSLKHGLRTISARPGFMFDEALGWTNRSVFGSLLSLGYDTKQVLFQDKIEPLNGLVRPPISTQKVAAEVYKRLENPDFSGVLSLDEMLK